MITGFHTIVYSDDADSTRAFFSDVLDWPSLDAGGGWPGFLVAAVGLEPTTSRL